MDSKAIKMRVLFLLFASILAMPSFGHITQLDSTSANTDSIELPVTDLDSAALFNLDQRLARLDSEHLMFTFQNLPEVDTTSSLPLADSVFEHYMAELDARTPFEMTYNPVVKRYLERYLKYGTARLSRMMAHGQYYFPMFEEHLDKYDMPLEIKYLAVVESALNPKHCLLHRLVSSLCPRQQHLLYQLSRWTSTNI